MPRSSVAEAAKTREAVIERAVAIASMDGLEGVTIGRLAEELGMSKAGVIGQFGTKAELQRAALDSASAVFMREVWEPSKEEEPGLPRLLALCDSWIAHVAGAAFPGGCFWTAASAEFDTRHGELHDEVEAQLRRWANRLRRETRTAIEAGDLPAEADVDQIVFELQAIPMGLNQSIQLFGDRRAVARARRAVRRVLGVEG